MLISLFTIFVDVWNTVFDIVIYTIMGTEA